VREFLLYHGAKNSVIQTQGHGSQSPLAPNDSDQNMAKNRRVEIKVEGL
jgi:outer membrane protein OmpA-like peptidoglycan-associated protein